MKEDKIEAAVTGKAGFAKKPVRREGRKAPSLFWRCLLAVFLMFFFYVFALAIAVGLLYIPYWQMTYGERINGRLFVMCIVGAGVILWSVIPRRDRFIPPGPRLSPEQHPALFRELRTVADAMQQAMPVEVYALCEVNAWVANRGGVMGIGGRRIMGLGLALLERLAIPELRAVVAHEFGHYHGGDTAIAPWIFKTRSAVIRTVEGLDDRPVLRLPFVGFAKVFLRITNAVSRQEEFAADALSAEFAGADVCASALRKVHGSSMAFDSFWSTEVVPVLQAGYRPPVSRGFRDYITRESIAKAVRDYLEHELSESRHDPYDSHPSLRERLQALGVADAARSPAEEPSAIELLNASEQIEDDQLVALMVLNGIQPKGGIAWKDTLACVYAPMWTKHAAEHAKALSGIRPEDLPALSLDPASLVKRFKVTLGATVPKDQMPDAAAAIVGSALAAALHKRGIAMNCEVGAPVSATLDGETVRPLEILQVLGVDKTLAPERWIALCNAVGLAGIDLGKAVVEANQKQLG